MKMDQSAEEKENYFVVWIFVCNLAAKTRND